MKYDSSRISRREESCFKCIVLSYAVFPLIEPLEVLLFEPNVYFFLLIVFSLIERLEVAVFATDLYLIFSGTFSFDPDAQNMPAICRYF